MTASQQRKDQRHVREILKDLELERITLRRHALWKGRMSESEKENRRGQGQTQTKHEWDGMGEGTFNALI